MVLVSRQAWQARRLGYVIKRQARRLGYVICAPGGSRIPTLMGTWLYNVLIHTPLSELWWMAQATQDALVTSCPDPSS